MAAENGECRDPVILDQWHPLWAIDEARPNVVHVTRLLGESVSFAVTAEGGAAVWRTRSDLTAGTPVDPESIADTLPSRCEFLLSLVDDESTTARIRWFVQTVFGQDVPILQNQNPKRLPLDPRAETPIRSDQASITYRRWLSDLGVTYGVIPAA